MITPSCRGGESEMTSNYKRNGEPGSDGADADASVGYSSAAHEREAGNADAPAERIRNGARTHRGTESANGTERTGRGVFEGEWAREAGRLSGERRRAKRQSADAEPDA